MFQLAEMTSIAGNLLIGRLFVNKSGKGSRIYLALKGKTWPSRGMKYQLNYARTERSTINCLFKAAISLIILAIVLNIALEFLSHWVNNSNAWTMQHHLLILRILKLFGL